MWLALPRSELLDPATLQRAPLLGARQPQRPPDVHGVRSPHSAEEAAARVVEYLPRIDGVLLVRASGEALDQRAVGRLVEVADGAVVVREEELHGTEVISMISFKLKPPE
tara:strand:+ start:292 stop:621 length:330 start_codon:yes stop_codon:yes gene_type:complete